MTPEQQNTLRTFTTNLRHAIRDREAVRIGRGLFQPSELTPVVEALDARRELLAALRTIATYDPTKWDATTLANIARAALARVEGEQ